jgi:hypothetical protein
MMVMSALSSFLASTSTRRRWQQAGLALQHPRAMQPDLSGRRFEAQI